MPVADNTQTSSERPNGAPWSLPDAAKYLGIGARSLERFAQQKRIKTIKIGARRMIPDEEVKRIASSGC